MEEGERSNFLNISPKIILIIFLESTSREELKSVVFSVVSTGKVTVSTKQVDVPILAPHHVPPCIGCAVPETARGAGDQLFEHATVVTDGVEDRG